MQKALWAYALGVVCHFALDASCHTYINHFEKTRRISHHEIEKEFEKYLMKKDGLDPFNWDFRQALSTNFRWAKLLHCFMACSQFKFISQSKAFCGFHVCSSRQARQNVMSFLPECVLRVYMVRFMVFLPMRKTIPDAVTDNEKLELLMKKSVQDAIKMSEELEKAYRGEMRLGKIFDQTFSGKEEA